MPVQSPEIVQTEVTGLDPAEVTNTQNTEPAITVSVGGEAVTIEIEGEKTETGIVVAQTPEGLAVGISSEEKPAPVKVSALSLKSIRAKKELEQQGKSQVKDDVHLPTEAFNQTDLLLQWTKYAQRLSDKGQKIMESLMLLSDPKLEGTTVVHELPNESAKADFESGKQDLVGYLRGKLHNHDIDIKTVVNESIDSRKAFTPQDRYNRLHEINPSLELLRKTFDLDF
jgi:hypothetical protein